MPSLWLKLSVRMDSEIDVAVMETSDVFSLKKLIASFPAPPSNAADHVEVGESDDAHTTSFPAPPLSVSGTVELYKKMLSSPSEASKLTAPIALGTAVDRTSISSAPPLASR